MPALLRRPVASALVAATSAVLLLGSATSAAAASKAHLVSLDAALAAMPVAKQLPGGVRLAEKIQLPSAGGVTPCLENLLVPDSDLPVKAGLAGAAFEPAHHQTPVAKQVTWVLSALVFHTPTQAKAAQKSLLAVEKSCPKSLDAGPLSSLKRTQGAPYTVRGWSGYRSIDEIATVNLVDGPEPEGVRFTQVYLVKGNVMLNLVEEGGIQPGTAARQEAWRKTVTTLLLTTFDKLEG